MLEEPRNTVEGRVIRCASPAGMRTRAVRVEPPTIKRHERGTRVAVVYYLCRNRLLEHPHFMEVPLASPQAGLYLRDVMSRLDALRGKGMAAMYSWSCKRRYKNGFVWHDLSQDDLLLPSQGTEYVLKGSELLHDQSPLPPQYHDQNIGASNAKVQCPKPSQQQESSPSPGSQRGWTSSSPSPRIGSAIPVTKEAAPAQPALPSSTFASTIRDEKQCRTPHACSSDSSSPKTSMPSSGATSPQLNNPVVAHDAATQPDEKVRGHNVKLQQGQQDAGRVSPAGPESVDESHCKHLPAAAAEYSCRRSESLQSLIRAEAASRRGVVEEEDKTATRYMSGKLKPTNLLMRLMACGPNHPGLGLVETSYNKAQFSQLEFPTSPELTPLGVLKLGTTSAVIVRASETEHSSGSLHMSVTGKLKRSSLCHDQDGGCEEEC